MQAYSVLIAILFILPTIKSHESIERLCANLNGTIPWNNTEFFDGRFTQYQDHFDPQNEIRWQQRFYVYPDTWKSGGPIIIYMEAESALTKNFFPPVVERIAKKFHGLQIGWEHRYYGVSQPEQHRQPFGNHPLRLLNVEQALEDIANFIYTLKSTCPVLSKSKVLVSGCSYAGTLTAWLRLKYPHLVDFAYRWFRICRRDTRWDGRLLSSDRRLFEETRQ